jgi:hypothetical protein
LHDEQISLNSCLKGWQKCTDITAKDKQAEQAPHVSLQQITAADLADDEF